MKVHKEIGGHMKNLINNLFYWGALVGFILVFGPMPEGIRVFVILGLFAIIGAGEIYHRCVKK